MSPDESNQQAMTEQGEKISQGVPAWAAWSGVGVFLLAIGAFIFWFMGGSFAGTTAVIPDPVRVERDASRQNWRVQRQQMNADGVHPFPNNVGYFVRVGQAYMDVYPPKDKSKKQETKYRFRYDSQALVTPEQWHLIMGLHRVASDGKMADTLNVSKDQLDRLRKFGQVEMELSKGDRQKLEGDWEEYDKATAKAEPEKKLVADLKQMAGKALGTTKEKASERVTEIGRILTPDQVRELTKLGAGQAVTAIPKKNPATQQTPTPGA